MAVAEERALASDKDLSDFAAKMDVPWRPKGMFRQHPKNAGVAVESWQTWFHFKKLVVFAYLFGMKHDVALTVIGNENGDAPSESN